MMQQRKPRYERVLSREHFPIIAVMSITQQLMPDYTKKYICTYHSFTPNTTEVQISLSSLTYSECGHLQSTYFLALYIHPNTSTISAFYDTVSIYIYYIALKGRMMDG
jgi:hypothetical protein